MLTLDPVLETSEATGFTLWPVADPPACGHLALSGGLSRLEVGTALASLAMYNDATDAPAGNAAELIRRLTEAECVIAQGGLRIQDPATNSTVYPGCCFGLESWRDWLDFTHGETPWLGHSPEPRVEHLGSVVHLWPGGHTESAGGSARRPIELSVAELPTLLGDVQQKLRGFLRQVERWAEDCAPPYASPLVAKLDQELGVEGALGDVRGVERAG
ncbi:hypothetical protein [Streptomyces inhibens]|uniref:hypothetical protein n=1 Tax=Streptomyces inhibens TaxID=2293571 RepID=UPI001EE6B68D|nr:hypothetical protein [Streptomyces inhibens]UKY53294.1 hypothetical protein KI385_33805 [Streptomyces inhibens]